MKILFISHDASRTGAPILLLRLIKSLKKYSDNEICILLKNGGDLESDFRKLGKTFIWNRHFSPDSLVQILKNRLSAKIGIQLRSRIEKHRTLVLNTIKDVDIIFNNTVCNGELLRRLPLQSKRVFSYFHEMQVITELFSSRQQMEYTQSVAEKIFVPSNAVKQFLINNYSYPEEKISLLRYIIPEPLIAEKDFKEIKKSKEKGKFNVSMCGTLHWRKGYDFLPLIMKKIIIEKKVTDIHFTWVGADKSSADYIILNNDLKKLNLDSFFSVINPDENIEKYLAKAHVLAVPSREDAFPLVVLEAARFEVPCIYFIDAGGILEFAGTDAGVPIDYLNVDMMAEKIIELKNNKALREGLGSKAKEKIKEFSKEKQIINELQQCFSNLIN